MAYENFQVCKEIIIPFNGNEEDGLTFDEYKEKYGIDLREIFNVDEGYWTPKVKAKILILDLSDNMIYPHLINDDADRLILYRYANNSGEINWVSYYTFGDDNTLSYQEI